MTPKPNASATILCVDDRHENLMIRKLMLEALGYHVVTSTNPYEALEALDSVRVNLVLLDYSFPNYPNGEWLAGKIRQKWPELKLVMLSGFPDIPEAAKSSVDALVTKGAEPSELRSALDRLLGTTSNQEAIDDARSENMELREKTRDVLEAARQSRKRRVG